MYKLGTIVGPKWFTEKVAKIVEFWVRLINNFVTTIGENRNSGKLLNAPFIDGVDGELYLLEINAYHFDSKEL